MLLTIPYEVSSPRDVPIVDESLKARLEESLLARLVGQCPHAARDVVRNIRGSKRTMGLTNHEEGAGRDHTACRRRLLAQGENTDIVQNIEEHVAALVDGIETKHL